MIQKSTLLFITFVCPFSSYAQEASQEFARDIPAKEVFSSKLDFWTSEVFNDTERGDERFRVLFYNVENLFDTENDPKTNDETFTPGGSYKWNEFKYNRKLNNLGKTLISTGGWEGTELIGLCEIENRFVLEELVTFSPLNAVVYEIIHHDSPDHRGIDVAALYRPDKFEVIHTDFKPLVFPYDSTIKTRDILYLKGILPNQDTLHYIINHWPSRYGGQKASEPRRLYAANVVRSMYDSIKAVDSRANVIIAGDFNDYPDDKSIVEVLKAKAQNDLEYSGELINLMYRMNHKAGTHVYQGHWGILDQFMVSNNLLNDTLKTSVFLGRAQIFNMEWLLETNAAGDPVPFRTNQGPLWKGGYSDHLPILLDLKLNKGQQ